MQGWGKNGLEAGIGDKSSNGIIVAPTITSDVHFVLLFDEVQGHLVDFLEELLFLQDPELVKEFHDLPMDRLSHECLAPIYPSFQAYVPLNEHFIASVYCFKDNREKATGSTFPYNTLFHVLYLLPLLSNSFFNSFMAL